MVVPRLEPASFEVKTMERAIVHPARAALKANLERAQKLKEMHQRIAAETRETIARSRALLEESRRLTASDVRPAQGPRVDS
jgi:hypothetical protein